MAVSEQWVMKDGRPSFPQAHVLEQRILHSLKSDEDKAAVNNAIVFAAVGHKDQKRNTGEPQIMHPLRAMQFIINTMPDYPHMVELLQVIALHDLIEDTEITKGDIAGLFSEEIAEAVDILSKKRNHHFKPEFEHAEVAYFEKLNNVDGKTSPLVRELVAYAKVADRLENMHTLETLVKKGQETEDGNDEVDRIMKQFAYIQETKRYIIPLLAEDDPLRRRLDQETAEQEAKIDFLPILMRRNPICVQE